MASHGCELRPGKRFETSVTSVTPKWRGGLSGHSIAGSRGWQCRSSLGSLAEIAEPSALPLIRRFLEHPSPDVVAAAIEALSQLGEPEAAADLARFRGDARMVIIEDFEDETKTTLGELAEDALRELGYSESD